MTSRPDDPRGLEETVDRLEEKVLGHRVEQTREDDPAGDTTEDANGEADEADEAGAEPTD